MERNISWFEYQQTFRENAQHFLCYNLQRLRKLIIVECCFFSHTQAINLKYTFTSQLKIQEIYIFKNAESAQEWNLKAELHFRDQWSLTIYLCQ